MVSLSGYGNLRTGFFLPCHNVRQSWKRWACLSVFVRTKSILSGIDLILPDRVLVLISQIARFYSSASTYTCEYLQRPVWTDSLINMPGKRVTNNNDYCNPSFYVDCNLQQFKMKLHPRNTLIDSGSDEDFLDKCYDSDWFLTSGGWRGAEGERVAFWELNKCQSCSMHIANCVCVCVCVRKSKQQS